MPCQDWAKPTTSQPPVTSLAILIAASFASPPVESSMTRGRAGTSDAERLGEVHHRRAEHRGEQVVEPARRVAHRGDDLRMAVAEDRAHLPGGEIQHAAAVGVVDEAALGAHRNERHERTAVVQHVPPRPRPECGVCRGYDCVHAVFPCPCQPGGHALHAG